MTFPISFHIVNINTYTTKHIPNIALVEQDLNLFYTLTFMIVMPFQAVKSCICKIKSTLSQKIQMA